jgi:Zn-dependent protease
MTNLDLTFQQPIIFVLTFLALVLSITIHEFAHVLSAYLQGDQTGRLMGRLTLNPLKHLDPYGTIFMVLSMLAGFGIGWGKPAPFNPNNLRNRRWGPFFVALAGPFSNIGLVALFGYTLRFLGPSLPDGNLLVTFLQVMTLINAGLAAFNLLPVPPLDGSRILGAVLGEYNPLVVTLNRYGFLILLVLIVIAQPLLNVWVGGGIHLILRVLGLA